ncbi:MAG TPA: beta-N-acetylhexosaminidase, partial [archaeon]|nr:beta-N-acetylhexosaminidase [archaeon]
MTKKIRLFLAFLIFSLGAKVSGTETPLWKAGINLIPYPQTATLEGDNFVFDAGVNIVLDSLASEADRFAAQDFASRLKNEWGIDAQVTSSSKIRDRKIILTRTEAAEKLGEQGYELTVGKGSITIGAGGEPGLFYGTRTLLQLIQKGRLWYYIKGMKITDWPDIPIRAAHYDTKHHQDKAGYVKEFIRTLADYKINMLVWEWEDKFACQSHPEIGAPGAFSMEEMQDFTRYARNYHVQLVPLVQGLGHVSYILKWPQYAHLREIPASNWEFCPLKNGSYELMFDLWEEAIKATPGSEFIHIGTDETYELGLGEECGCKAKAEEIGRYGLMQIFVKRCFDHLSGLGRKVMCWGGEYRPEEQIKPPKGLIAFGGFSQERDKESADNGYPVFVYDPNPGIEHLFLPYFYRLRDNDQVESCLENSFKVVSQAALSGIYEGM